MLRPPRRGRRREGEERTRDSGPEDHHHHHNQDDAWLQHRVACDGIRQFARNLASRLFFEFGSVVRSRTVIFDGVDCGTFFGFDATDLASKQHSCRLLGHPQAGFGKGAGT